jgi:hypothetical protein
MPVAITAEDILAGFKYNKETREITITPPKALMDKFGADWVQEAGKILNAEAKARDMRKPVFYEGDKETWATIESDVRYKTEAGKTYPFTIPVDSVYKTRGTQEDRYGQGAPLGAIAIAEACHRLNTDNAETLFKDENGNRVWVRGSAPGFALFSDPGRGVDICGADGDDRRNRVAFAPLASPRNAKT